MKKLLLNLLLLVIGIGIGFGGFMLLSKNNEKQVQANPPYSSDLTATSTPTDNIVNNVANNSFPNEMLLKLAYRTASFIKSGDYQALSKLVHPEYGCVFSPYATVNLNANQCFSAAQISAFGNNSTKYIWGTYDGSGNPIELTPAQYFSTFVYNADYLQAPLIGINHVIKSGNSLENISEVFPNAQYVELHFPQIDPTGEGYDWCTLRLVFEQYNGELYLTALIHSELTI